MLIVNSLRLLNYSRSMDYFSGSIEIQHIRLLISSFCDGIYRHTTLISCGNHSFHGEFAKLIMHDVNYVFMSTSCSCHIMIY
jgi:hypothetical protein